MARVAIFIDGGYFLKRLPRVAPHVDPRSPDAVVRAVARLVRSHLARLNEIHQAPTIHQLLYRTFYYDARPYTRRAHTPVGRRPVNYSRSAVAVFRQELFRHLRRQPNVAVRPGEVRLEPRHPWMLKPPAQVALARGRLAASELDDTHFRPTFRQKGVDMRMGLDVATIALKKQADTMVLVSGDADFVPAAKLARREGMRVVLDPLWQPIPPDLSEHVDVLASGFPRPNPNPSAPSTRRFDRQRGAPEDG